MKMFSMLAAAALLLGSCATDAPTPDNRPKPKEDVVVPPGPVEPQSEDEAELPALPDYTPSSAAVQEIPSTLKATLGIGKENGRTISRRLLGFNIVYCDNPDSRWSDGTLANAIKDVHPGYLRYPGGTVVTYFHWKNPSGNGWDDSWNPSYKTSSNKKPSEFMDVDEYLALLKKTGALPLMGINCNSGFVYNRLDEGLKEALDLMKYVKGKGVDVKYWYIGNEPFSDGGNGGVYTPEKYAEMVKTFAVKMKEYDPSIKIAVNDHGNIFKNWSDYDKILSVAGGYIDVIDVHSYWSHGTANWDKWIQSTPCGMAGSGTYEEEVAKFRERAAAKGYPNLEFASLEWNCGPSGSAQNPFTSADQITLVQAEMIMQFMKGGMDFACFWPLFWKGDYAFRGFAAKGNSTLFPIAAVMKDFGYYQGRNLVDATISGGNKKLYCLAAKDPGSGKTLVSIINKNDDVVGLQINGATLSDSGKAIVKSYTYDKSTDKIVTDGLHWEKTSNVALKPFSLTMIVLLPD